MVISLRWAVYLTLKRWTTLINWFMKFPETETVIWSHWHCFVGDCVSMCALANLSNGKAILNHLSSISSVQGDCSKLLFSVPENAGQVQLICHRSNLGFWRSFWNHCCQCGGNKNRLAAVGCVTNALPESNEILRESRYKKLKPNLHCY